MKQLVVGVPLILLSIFGYAQVSQNPQPVKPPADTVKVLEEVMVHAFEANRKAIEVPSAVTVLAQPQLTRFNNYSLVSAVNTTPGVRMEERSPGSYRLNIRGSTLRSPFGVRNVKIYYNDIPFTDPGGNTYLNQIGFYNIGSMEIIREPGSSLYGAGTGGVILLNSDREPMRRGATINYTGGSYGTNSFQANIRGGTDTFNVTTRYQYQNSNGYRDHTKLERTVVSSDIEAKIGRKGILNAHFLRGDLFYETPGALTAAEFAANPKAARPRVGQTPGSAEANAAITQNMFLAGFHYTSIWNSHWQNSVSLYGAYSKLTNPTTRNYERRTEPHYGSRGILQYQGDLGATKFTWQGGIEVQQQYSASRVYRNVGGNPDTLQTDDEITNRAASAFTQFTFELKYGWILTGGLSINLLKVNLERSSKPGFELEKNFNNQAAPRVAVLKKLNERLSVYGSVAKGFSPPTTAEILPSTGVITTDLEAETGINTELGLKGNFLKNRFYVDISAFYFRLKNTIVQRRDETGGDYFVNAGNTKQNGIETYLSYNFLDHPLGAFRSVKAWMSDTWHNFHYDSYIKVADDTSDYSGNRLPSVPKQFFVLGLDALTNQGFYGNLTYFYSDPIPLNDANTAFASSYNLFNAKLGFKKSIRKNIDFDLYFVADNIFNVKYSLGNDINALGGRFYNAAPGANFSAGFSVFYGW